VKTYRIEFIDEAEKEFKELDKSQRLLVLKQIVKLEMSPYYGKPLGNKKGIDLTGFYKLYADKKKIRIVYTVTDDTVKIIAISKRENFEAYIRAAQRIKHIIE